MILTLSHQVSRVGPDWLDRAVGEDRQRLQETFIKAADSTSSISIEHRREDAFQSLLDAAREASKENWDGYGALPVNQQACSYALELLSDLPFTIPIPEIAIDSDGEVALDWDYGPRLIFSVRVGRDGTMNYAGLENYSSFHGVEVYHSSIPEAVLQGIERVVKPRTR